jgi:localization factor PodJL
VKGIDPKAREIAKDLARRSGMTLGEWLNQVIYEDNAQTAPGAPSQRAGSAVERPASENRTPRRGGDDLERVLSALRDLSERFDASIQEQAETSARFERAIADLQTDQTRVAERLHAVEQGGVGAASDGKIETLRALEGALNKVAGHLASGENRQREAMAVMRKELGDEMVRVADQVNRKVLEVENRGADAIAQVGAEVTRVATAVEQRLRKADDAQAESLEKLGGEIARITERLSERIAAAERRASAAVDGVGEQIARVTDRIHARQERSESELVDRMRQSEERTAKLLEEARQTIDRRLLRAGAPAAEEPPVSSAFAGRWTPVDDDPAEAAVAVEDEGFDAESILEAPAYDGLVAGAAADVDYLDVDDDDSQDGPHKPGVIGLNARAPTLIADPDFVAPDDLAALDALAKAIGADPAGDESWNEPPVFERVRASPPTDEAEVLRPSARNLIAEARAAAFAEPAVIKIAEREAELAPEDAGVPFSSFSARRSKPTHSMRGVLLAGGAAASIGLAATGYVALHPETIPGLVPAAATSKQIPVGPPSSPAAAPAPQAAVALATTPAPKSDVVDPAGLFTDASAKVDAGDPSGVAPLRTAANLGYAPAQRRLGKLYEDGGAGVEKDPKEGRLWTVRAAANGDARAMHNLGLDYYEGAGGPKSPSVAAEWFGRAAQLGLRDSQYNLARFYEAGIGVQRDLPTAYRWYLIAGRAGDTEAAARGAALKSQLTAEQSARAEAMANAFRPDPPAPPASLTAGLESANAKQLALAARALAKLGYYKGADDGAPSQALGQAIQAFQRDRGLAQNGQLSPELVQTFANISQ